VLPFANERGWSGVAQRPRGSLAGRGCSGGDAVVDTEGGRAELAGGLGWPFTANSTPVERWDREGVGGQMWQEMLDRDAKKEMVARDQMKKRK